MIEYKNRTYREHLQKERWYSFTVAYKETDLWIGIRDEDGTTDSDNTGAHHDEGTRTDGISEAQMEDVKQAKLFTFP